MYLMEEKEIIKAHKLESENWWYKGRRDILQCLMPAKVKTVFEVGTGSGETVLKLKEMGLQVSGIDISKLAVQFAKKRKLNIKCIGIEDYAFTNKYDLVLVMDVLEHIKNDGKILKKISQVTEYIFITVPAFQFLFGPHDHLCHHYHRYNIKGFEKLLSSAGYKIIKISYWNFFLFIPSLFLKIAKKIFYKNSTVNGNSDLIELPTLLNSIFYNLTKLENILITKGVKLPLGTSIICLAKKY